MKIAIFGLPCAGKTTLMENISGAKILLGSKELEKNAGKSFSELCEKEKYKSPYICADAKYFVVKLLKEKGFKVTAFGDSKIDLYK